MTNALSNLGFSPVGARSLDRGEPEEHAPAALRPLLLVEKEQIGLRELKAWRAILRCLFFFPSIFLSHSVVLSPPVCVGCVVLGHVLSQLAVWSCYWSGLVHPGGDIQDAVVSTARSAIRSLFFFFFAIRRRTRVLTVCFFAVVMARRCFRLWIQISTRTRRCTVRYEKHICLCIFVDTHHISGFLFLITPQVKSITGVKIVNYCSPLYFANAEIFRQRVIRKVQ